jgi:MoaA/NifB/PqqE/SkfB family radical SAM enzyme
MKKLVAIESNASKDRLVIEYDLGNICNFSCSYCFEGSHEGDVPWPDYNIVKERLGHLINYYKTVGNKKEIVISFIGGEVTLWSKLGDLVKHLKEEYDCKVTLLSNGSRTIRWWNQYGHYFDRIMISVHNEQADIEHIKAVGDLIYSKGIIFEATVMMDPDNWDKCVSIVNQLKTSKKRWMIITDEIRYDNQLRYSSEQLKYLKKKFKRLPNLFYFFTKSKLQFKKYWAIFNDGSRVKKTSNLFLLEGYRNFYGWECDLGIEEIFITRDGRITGTCCNYLYGEKQHYNIYDPDFIKKFKPKLKPTKCASLICNCQREIVIQKRKIIEIKSK